MSMQELPDDQLDGLFRKSLEESEPPYDAAAWQHMQAKLVEHDREQFVKRWLRRGLPIGLLLLLPISIWLLTRSDATQVVSVQKPVSAERSVVGTQHTHGEKVPEGAVADSRIHPTTAVGNTAKSTVSSVSPGPPARVRSDLATTRPANQPDSSALPVRDRSGSELVSNKPSRVARQSIVANKTVVSVDNQITTVKRAKKSVRRSDRLTAGVSANVTFSDENVYNRTAQPAFKEQSGSGDAERIGDGEPPLPVAEAGQERFRLALQPLRGHLTLPAGRPLTIDRSVTAPESEHPIRQQPARRVAELSIRTLVSPDLSTIGLTNFSRPGTNIGIMLEYQLQRWHIQAGVLRSVKVYQASGSMYEGLTYNQWPVIPSSIGGRCNMLDIPINLRYDVAILPRRRALPPSRWFISGGTTTYYMLREDYTYNYDNPTDPRIQYRDWSTETGRYGFSQLNVSAGYERAVTQRLFWQVEPFLKVPLKGVGFYKVNLLSTGAFFSLRYRL